MQHFYYKTSVIYKIYYLCPTSVGMSSKNFLLFFIDCPDFFWDSFNADNKTQYDCQLYYELKLVLSVLCIFQM